MSDLRGILGDRYDEVLTKATKRALFNYPNLPISIVEHEALAAQALAAVLPDLLADVWDEGFQAGDDYGAAVVETHAGYHHSLPVRPESPYRPETTAGEAADAPAAPAAPDATNPPPDPSAAATGPHSPERTTR